MSLDWYLEAACKNAPTSVFFPEDNSGHFDAALAVCRSCEVVTQCRDYAIDANLEQGIWGGMTPSERRKERRKRARQRQKNTSLAPRFAKGMIRRHGIRSSYIAGCRCEPCTNANREYERGRKRIRVRRSA